nr:MAG TPA: hypothetical protein [Inoviridae sp.]
MQKHYSLSFADDQHRGGGELPASLPFCRWRGGRQCVITLQLCETTNANASNLFRVSIRMLYCWPPSRL